MRRGVFVPVLSIGLGLLVAPFATSSPANPASTVGQAASRSAGGELTQSYGDPGGDYLTFTITGADLKLTPGTAATYTGTSTGKTITLSGQMSVTRAQGVVSDISMSAKMGEQTWHWPAAGGSESVSGRTVSQSFKVSFVVGSSKFYDKWVSGGVSLGVCGGVCGGYSVDFNITLKKPSSPPVARAYPVKKVLKPGTYGLLPLSVKDESGKAKVYGTLYEGGTSVRTLKTTSFVVADGRWYDWKAKLAADLMGPLYFCVWAENPSGQKSVKAPNSSCAWLSLLVDIDRVSNTCGGEGWDSIVAAENYFGNESSYKDPGTGKTYTVNFADACNLHDAGYGGYTVKDKLHGGVPVDFHNWSRERVDNKFQEDMKAICRRDIPAAATTALKSCLSGSARFTLVRQVGNHFFDADLMKPGLQSEGPRDNS
ncbi:MAG: hypothetical protein ACXVY3_06440 [Gaiellaceae bacterium]